MKFTPFTCVLLIKVDVSRTVVSVLPLLMFAVVTGVEISSSTSSNSLDAIVVRSSTAVPEQI